MATFSTNSAKSGWTAYKFFIKNNSSRHVEYNFNDLIHNVGTEIKFGNLASNVNPGQEQVVNFDSNTDTFEQGNVNILSIDNKKVYFRFWSSGGGSQYININQVSPLVIVENRDTISKGVISDTIITVDGGGGKQETLNIHIQIYNS
jgi:hypothetical protein